MKTLTIFLQTRTPPAFTPSLVRHHPSLPLGLEFRFKGCWIPQQNGLDCIRAVLDVFGIIFTIEATASIFAHAFGGKTLTVEFEAFGFFASAANVERVVFGIVGVAVGVGVGVTVTVGCGCGVVVFVFGGMG